MSVRKIAKRNKNRMKSKLRNGDEFMDLLKAIHNESGGNLSRIIAMSSRERVTSESYSFDTEVKPIFGDNFGKF